MNRNIITPIFILLDLILLSILLFVGEIEANATQIEFIELPPIEHESLLSIHIPIAA